MKTLPAKLAVIGAGISGLICAKAVREAGWEVRVFEKSRGVGGRMATRRAGDGLQFDHGAQYFTVRDETFNCYVEDWVAAGVVQDWHGRIVDLARGEARPKQDPRRRLVGVPGMSAVCKHLAKGLEISFQTRLLPPTRTDGGWRLKSELGHELGEFDCVITSAPAPQSAELLVAAPDLQSRARSVVMSGCWAVMVVFDLPLVLDFDGAFVHDSSLSWIARNDSKPRRSTLAARPATNPSECWVMHASAEWTDANIEASVDAVVAALLDAFWESTGAVRQVPRFAVAHRWRYAISPQPLTARSLFDPQRGIGACGDWCNGPRVEGAFLSGLAAADQILARKVHAV